MGVFATIEQRLPQADIDKAVNLAINPDNYTSFVMSRIIDSVISGTPIVHHVEDWPKELSKHLAQTLLEADPEYPLAKETADAAVLLCAEFMLEDMAAEATHD